ncbi:MAG TPA: hypothetical protein VF143_04570 [Candidatus Nanopelagicales bacterium]
MPQQPGASAVPGPAAHPEATEAAVNPAPGEQALPPTGDPRVDDALSRLAEAGSLPLAEQVEVYADIHRRLSGVLADPGSRA